MADELDDIRGLRPKMIHPWSLPAWINMVVIGFGLLVIVGYTSRMLEGRRPTGFEWLFGWDMGSWWWVGQLVIIVGWCILVSFRVLDLTWSRSRHRTSTK